MTTETTTDTRFDHMQPAFVWELFCTDTPEQEYVRFIRTDYRTLLCVEADDSDLVLLAEEIAENCDVTAEEAPQVVAQLARYMRNELGDAAARTELVAKAIRADAHSHLAGVVTELAQAISDVNYVAVSPANAQHMLKGVTDAVSELWDLLNG